MEEALYHLHYQQEETHWWFAARSIIVRHVVERLGAISPGETILDIGCGTGAILSHLATKYRTVGIDMSPLAVEYSRRRGLSDVRRMTVQEFPAHEYSVRTALLLDVVEHIDEDVEVLTAAARIVAPNGRVVVTVPAHPWLWSAHDQANHHVRRYTKKSLREALQRAGLKPIRLTYYNSILFPLGVLRKLLDRNLTVEKASRQLSQPSRLLNGLLRSIFAFEKHLVTWFPMPFGISLLAVATPIGSSTARTGAATIRPVADRG